MVSLNPAYMPDRSFKVFVVEDDEWYNKLLVHCVSLNPDIEVESFTNGHDLIKNLTKHPDVVTLDYRLPDIMGDELLNRIRDFDPQIKTIVVSEQDDIEVAVEMLHNGAYDYLVKSREIKDRLVNSINNILRTRNLENKVAVLQKEVEKKYNFQSAIIGNSPLLKNVFDLMAKAAKTSINVSITGETGTGKEMVAKAIHYNSDRKEGAYVAVNVSALPKDLIESELFGHEKGAFTGAIGKRKGRFEEANGGTLFLDEIAELELPLQAKFLRVLQEKEFTSIGSNAIVKTNFRLIVATHKNLADEVKKGTFREDLFYRIIGLTIALPPLRERGHDILVLAHYFIEQFCKENNIPEKKLNHEAQTKLLAHSYPGNVRELKTVVETAVVLADGEMVTPDDLVFQSQDAMQQDLEKELTLREYNYRIIQFMLNRYDKDITTVAKKLAISPATIYRMLKEFHE